MAVETELKLTLPVSALPALRRHPIFAGIVPVRRRLDNIYYDTPALDLKRMRVALRHRRVGDRLFLTVKSAEPSAGGLARRSEWEAPSQPDVFDFSHVDDKHLRQHLEVFVPQLQPAFSTDFMRTTWVVEQSGARIEVALDRGEVRCDRTSANVDGPSYIDPICELELELLDGPTAALFDLALILHADLPVRPAVVSKAERGFRLFTQSAYKAFRASASSVTMDMSPRDAFAVTAMACVEQLQRNESGVMRGDDPEFVHQARVSIRRLRTALRFWAPVLPEGFVADFDPAWQALARVLGEQRNLDVFVSSTLSPLLKEFPDYTAFRKLSATVSRRRKATLRVTRAALEHPEYARLLLRFVAAVQAMSQTAESVCSPVSMEKFSKKRLARIARRLGPNVGRSGENLDGATDSASYHCLRIDFKRLRYSLEFCAALYSGRRLTRYLAAVMMMQEILGDINDIAVAKEISGVSHKSDFDPLLAAWLAGRAVLLAERLPSAQAVFATCTAARPVWKKSKKTK